MPSNPDIDALVACGRRMAQELSVSPVPEEELRSKIKEILFERDYLEAFHKGIITLEELRNVLLGHMSDLVLRCAGAEQPKERVKEDVTLNHEIEVALLGKR